MRVQAGRGRALRCRGWRQEALLRMLENNLENAEDPERLVVYGGSGKAARNWDAYRALVAALKALGDEETLLVQSGKPVGVLATHRRAPRVLLANSNLVPAWATPERFRELEDAGLMMYGQMTAGSWCYIGTQGIVQGTYETLAALARTHFGGSLRGRIVLTGGMGGMGGAQPLAVTMLGGVCLDVEVDEARIDRRVALGYCDAKETDPAGALRRAREAANAGTPLSLGVVGNCAETHPRWVEEGFVPDVVTDQTSAHDALHGYVPAGLPLADAEALRARDPRSYERRSYESMAAHMRAMLAMQARGAVAFDYGNNLRGQARKAGVEDAFRVPGFVPAYVRPLFCEGRGPFRWIALTGDPQDIHRTDEMVKRLFPDNALLRNWIDLAHDRVPFQGLPARVCWLGYGERARFALALNAEVRAGTLGPLAITRDHLDSGSVASPYRETEGMRDGSDAVADWPLLNALANVACGADLVALHAGGGVGVGNSVHAGMAVVCDGTPEADERIRLVFAADPGLGIMRHADAGYPEAVDAARRHRVAIPMLAGASGPSPRATRPGGSPPQARPVVRASLHDTADEATRRRETLGT